MRDSIEAWLTGQSNIIIKINTPTMLSINAKWQQYRTDVEEETMLDKNKYM